MSKKDRPHKLPGGNVDQATVEAQKAQQRKNEELQMSYGIFRTIFELQCIHLGVEEVAALEYQEAGLMATVKRQKFNDNDREKRVDFMQNRLRDFHAMTRQDTADKQFTSLVREAISFIKDELSAIEELVDIIDAPPAAAPSVLLDAAGNPLEKKADEPKPAEEQKESALAS